MRKKILGMLIILLAYSSYSYSKNYKGAEIYSKAAVKYGSFEMSMKSGAGSGLLFTFFLYKGGSEQAGAFWEEIDLEIFGKNSAKSFQSNIITDGVTGSNKMSEKLHTFVNSLADTFHIYRIEWTPAYVAWFIDGKELRRDKTTQVATLTNAESIRFNAWISSSANWAGAFSATVLPQYQVVDWFKYSSYVAVPKVLLNRSGPMISTPSTPIDGARPTGPLMATWLTFQLPMHTPKTGCWYWH